MPKQHADGKQREDTNDNAPIGTQHTTAGAPQYSKNDGTLAHSRRTLDETQRSLYDYKEQEAEREEKYQYTTRTPTRTRSRDSVGNEGARNNSESKEVESDEAHVAPSPNKTPSATRTPGREVSAMPFTSPKMFSSMLDLSMNISKDTSGELEKLRSEGTKLFDDDESLTQILKSPTLKTDASGASSFFRGEYKKVASVIGHTLVPTISSTAQNSLPPLPHPQHNSGASTSLSRSFLLSPNKLDFDNTETPSYVHVNSTQRDTQKPRTLALSSKGDAPSKDGPHASSEEPKTQDDTAPGGGEHKEDEETESGSAQSDASHDGDKSTSTKVDEPTDRRFSRSDPLNKSLTRKIFAPKLPPADYAPPPTTGETIIVEESIATGYFKSMRRKVPPGENSKDTSVSVHVRDDDDDDEMDMQKLNTLGATSLFAKNRLAARKKFSGKSNSTLDSAQFPPGHNFFRPVELTFALVSQVSSGIIAGITLQTLLSFVDGDDLSMITTLRSHAKVTRPIIFILSTLAFLGSLNSTLTATSILSNFSPVSWFGPWQSLDTSNKALVKLSQNYPKLFTLCCLYSIIFTTVLMTKQLESYLGSLTIPWGNPRTVYPNTSTLDPNVDHYYVATYEVRELAQWKAWIGLLIIRILAASAVFLISFAVPYGMTSVYDVKMPYGLDDPTQDS